MFFSQERIFMRCPINYLLLLLFFSHSFISCSYLQKIQDYFQDRPTIEGEEAGDISDTDIDSDQRGSDSGNIDGLSTVHFGLDSSNLTESVKDILKANKAWMDSHSEVKRIILEGHCDPLGSEAYNVGLGERRAQTVYNYLKSIGLREDQMSIVSYGEERLFSETDNDLNRRVNFVPQY